MMGEKNKKPLRWAECTYDDLLEYIQPTQYIVDSTDYNDSYPTPVLTAGKSFIKGYTNEEGGIFENYPTIIFDDFTTASKYVDFSFKVKSSAMKILVPSSKLVDLKFVYYSMQSNQIRSDTHKRYWISVYAKKQIWLPPLNEQKRIMAKIEELFSELDKGIESLKTARAQLKIYRQTVLKSAFEGNLISTKSKWQETSLGQLTSLVTSGSRGWAKYYSDTGDIFIRAQNLKYDHLDLTEKAYVEIPNKIEGTRTQTQKNDLLITITGANVTKSALIKNDIGNAYVSQHVALCRPTEEVFPAFLYWFVVAEAVGRKQLNESAYGAGKPGLNLQNIKSVKLSIPSYEEQISVVDVIEEKLSVCSQLEQTIETELKKSEALRQSILKKAFSGKLVPKDPADEPASVLLERIKAKKEKLSVKPKKKTRKRKTAA